MVQVSNLPPATDQRRAPPGRPGRGLRGFLLQDWYRLHRAWVRLRGSRSRRPIADLYGPAGRLRDPDCLQCRFPMALDDVAVCGPRGRGICLRCYGRLTASDRTLPPALAREIETLLTNRTLANPPAMAPSWRGNPSTS